MTRHVWIRKNTFSVDSPEKSSTVVNKLVEMRQWEWNLLHHLWERTKNNQNRSFKFWRKRVIILVHSMRVSTTDHIEYILSMVST